LLPDFVLAYAIHLLAHDPDWEDPDDVARLNVVKSALWFIMEPIMAGGNNYTLLRQLLEQIKHSQDALRPGDESINTKIYMACDIALGLLLTRSSNIVWRVCEFEIKLPRSLFHRAPSSFSNPDFAQICPSAARGGGGDGSGKTPPPLITFTPTKNSKAVKDGLIPPQLLKVKNPASSTAKSRQKRRQQQMEESVEESSEVVVTEDEEKVEENVETVEEAREESDKVANGTNNSYDVDLDKSDTDAKAPAKGDKSSKKRKNEDESSKSKPSSKRAKPDDEEKSEKVRPSKTDVTSPKLAKSNTSRPNLRFRPLTREDDVSVSDNVNDASYSDTGHTADLDSEITSLENCHIGNQENERESTSNAEIIRRLLRPVKEKHSSKEAEEIRITQLYKHALQMSSESESSLDAIPLLESIVHSFLFRASSGAPPHLKTINFASCRLLATLYLKSNKPETAFKLLKTAVELDPTDLGVWIKLATTSITLNKFEDADKALFHILQEQPSHPVALYWAQIFYFGVCELLVCLKYSIRSLLINPRDQMAVYLIKQVLSIESCCDHLMQDLYKELPTVLEDVEVPDAVKEHVDERWKKIRAAHRAMIDEQNKQYILKTFKFPGPLYKLTWEHLANAVVSMFDKLMKEDLVEAGLDLGSLFEDGEIPPKEPQVVEPMETALSPAQLSQEEFPASASIVDLEMDAQSPDANATEYGPSPTNTNSQPNSQRLRRPAVPFDESSAHAGPSGSHSQTATPVNLTGPATAVPALKSPTGANAAAAEAQRIRNLWMRIAKRFHNLLPVCFEDLAAISSTKTPNGGGGGEEKSLATREPQIDEDEEATTAAIEAGPTEADLVTEFLRILSVEATNAIFMGIPLLLQMTERVKVWTQSYSTAYLALSARIRSTLPVWECRDVPEVEHPYPPTEELLIPTGLIRLRRRPTIWQIANLHFSYIESRLDALVLCRKAEDSAKRHLASLNGSGVEDTDLKALSEALQADSKPYWEPDETIHYHDECKMLRALRSLPEDSPETTVFEGRLLWIKYEWSSVVHNYDAMKDYLLQAKEFITKNGPLRRVCSFRNSYITLERIDELLAEVEDVSIGARLEHLCKSQQDTTKLIKALKDCIQSHSNFLQNKSKVISSMSPSARLESLPRICHMFFQPLRTLSRRLTDAYNDYSSDEEDEVVTKSALDGVIVLAIRSWRIGTRFLDLVSTIIGGWDEVGGDFSNLLSKEEVADVLEAWKSVTVALDLLRISWEVIINEMDYGATTKVFNKKLTLESLCTRVLFTFKPPLKEGEESKPTALHNMSFGEICQGLCLTVNIYAWRLYATGALGLPPPNIYLDFTFFPSELLDALELGFPLHLLHSDLAIYRSLYLLGDEATEKRGRAAAPPSRYCLHLFHDLIPLINTNARCISPGSNPLGLTYLRCIGVTVAETLKKLSEGFYHFCKAAPDVLNSLSTRLPTASFPDNISNSEVAWPQGAKRLGDILAQIIHCLCGISTKNKQQIGLISSDTTDSLSISCGSYDTSILYDGTRFKPSAKPPEYEIEAESGGEEEDLTFKPYEPELPERPPSCLAPRPPLWTKDAALFYEVVESHRPVGFDLTNPPANAKVGCWWLGAKPSDKMAIWLMEAVKLLPPAYKEFFIPEEEIEDCLSRDRPLPIQKYYLSDMINLMYYLIADYHMKTFKNTNYENFQIAKEIYKNDLRVSPNRINTWASLALIYSYDIEQILNITDPRTERVSSQSVTTCFRCFQVTLELEPNYRCILLEQGTSAYQLHSYASRILKKSLTRGFKRSHLHLASKWYRKKLFLSHNTFLQSLNLDRRLSDKSNSSLITETPAKSAESGKPSTKSDSSPSLEIVSVNGVPESTPVAKSSDSEEVPETRTGKLGNSGAGEIDFEEQWLPHYMLAKCEEKAGPGVLFHDFSQPGGKRIKNENESRGDWILRVVTGYKRTAEILHANGAKYPKRINYNKLQTLAVESIELYYRIHAFLLKEVLKAGEPQPSSDLPLRQICEVLYDLTQSPFITEPAKFSAKGRGKKRQMTFPEPSTKVPRLEGPGTSTPVIDVDSLDFSFESKSVEQLQPPEVPLIETPAKPDFSTLSDLELWRSAIEYCKNAMEVVLQRLPLHYKAMYRLAHLYFTAPGDLQDLDKAMAIMMGPFDHVAKIEYGGLFKDRKQSNFFHGVWRIPTADIDRSGNFAAHMYRSTYLVLDILRSRGDWTRMLQVFHQLRKQPSEDKRGFLGECDRVFLARRALNLIHPSLCLFLNKQSNRSQEESDVTMETLKQIYRLHTWPIASNPASRGAGGSGVQIHSPLNALSPSSSPTAADKSPQSLADLLVKAYRLCPTAWEASGPDLSADLILKRCAELSSGSSSFSISKSSSSTSSSSIQNTN
uniref:TPR_REGION domain-containing protein n=1 Tax=Rodentolepis nana TaxID=102285 RepID=A0A158QJ13_RODNA